MTRTIDHIKPLRIKVSNDHGPIWSWQLFMKRNNNSTHVQCVSLERKVQCNYPQYEPYMYMHTHTKGRSPCKHGDVDWSEWRGGSQKADVGSFLRDDVQCMCTHMCSTIFSFHSKQLSGPDPQQFDTLTPRGFMWSVLPALRTPLINVTNL